VLSGPDIKLFSQFGNGGLIVTIFDSSTFEKGLAGYCPNVALVLDFDIIFFILSFANAIVRFYLDHPQATTHRRAKF
jgi:hypothetical protein